MADGPHVRPAVPSAALDVDIVSHAGWGYAISRWRGERDARIGALAGAAPDLLAFIPSGVHRLIADGWHMAPRAEQAPAFWRTPGPLPPDLQYAYDHYYVYSHSLVILACAAAALWLARKRSWIWFCAPYGLHILMDIPTHVRFQTPFLYPLTRWTIQGRSWSEPWIFFPQWVLLIAALVYVRRRYARPA